MALLNEEALFAGQNMEWVKWLHFVALTFCAKTFT